MIARFSTITWVVFFCVAASALYLVKYRVQDVKDDVKELEASIEAEQESLQLLHAEWAYLNRPERLQQLAQQYLSLQPVSPERMLRWDDVPLKSSTVAAAQEVR